MESIAITRSEKSAFILASALNNLTRVTLDLHGDTDAAERYADEAIHVSQEAGTEWTVAVAYEMKGIIALHRKNCDEARTLFGKAFHAYQEIGASFDEHLIALREKMGLIKFDSAWSRGHALTMQQAIEFALENADN